MASTLVYNLARVIMSEASVGNQTERTCVGNTVVNRMLNGGFGRVEDVWGAFAHGQAPTQPIVSLAQDIITGAVGDLTGGCTHFYSPRSMPKQGESTGGYDVSGGLETVPGIGVPSYRPGWAVTMAEAVISGVRPAYFKFYKH